eukprot:Skav231567  [mRNA]  locus=scaffold481:183900:184777:- [translate_table: standard]
MLAARVPRLLAALESIPREVYWAPWHFFCTLELAEAFCSHHLVSVFYYAWLLRRGYNLAQVRFYKPQLWQKHKRGSSGAAAR